jgi:hypothetical protein
MGKALAMMVMMTWIMNLKVTQISLTCIKAWVKEEMTAEMISMRILTSAVGRTKRMTPKCFSNR